MSLRRVALGTVCAQDRTSVRPGHGDDLPYLGLEGIESGTGQFVVGELSKTPEAPQANSFRFDERHVLYGKLRPYLNKVALPTAPGKCSTEIIPLLPTPPLDRQYMSYFLRAPATVQQIAERSSGARMPRADMDFVLSLPIGLPPINEQRRIVDLLARAEGIIRLRREAQQKAAELIPAIFIDMFGDPSTNPRGWPTRRVAEVCSLVRGSSPRPQGDPKFFGGPVPRLMIADITRDGVYVTPTIDSLTEEGAAKSRPMLAGDVVMAVSGAVGLPAILAVDACIHDGFVGFRALDAAVTPGYLYSFLAAYRRHSVTQAVGATFQNLKTDQIKEWLVPLPPLAAQHQFQQLTSELRGFNRQQSSATATACATFESLLHRAFQAVR
jgi:hypothetical protein